MRLPWRRPVVETRCGSSGFEQPPDKAAALPLKSNNDPDSRPSTRSVRRLSDAPCADVQQNRQLRKLKKLRNLRKFEKLGCDAKRSPAAPADNCRRTNCCTTQKDRDGLRHREGGPGVKQKIQQHSVLPTSAQNNCSLSLPIKCRVPPQIGKNTMRDM